MITVLACDECLNIIRIVGDDSETRRLIHNHVHWKEGWPCFRTGCNSSMRLVPVEDVGGVLYAARANVIQAKELSPEEAFRALCGFGLPSELGTDLEVVQALLLSSKVIGVQLKKSSSDRTVLENISLENGLVLHLAGSPSGAVIFKITRGEKENEKGV